MKGKHPRAANALRAKILADDNLLTAYVEQRLISQLGGLIDRILTSRRMTQTRLAEIIQMHQPDVNALIRGRAGHMPTIPTLRRLATGLGVPIAIRIDSNGDVELEEAAEKVSEQRTHDGAFEAVG